MNDNMLDCNSAQALLVTTISNFIQTASLYNKNWAEIKRVCKENPMLGGELLLDLPIEYLSLHGKAVAAAAGLGKTSTLIRELLGCSGVVWFLIPNMKLAEQVERDFKNAGHQHVYLYRGRNSDNCARFNLIKQLTQYVSSNEQSIGHSLCKQGDKLCPYYEGCPYIQKLDIIRNAIQPSIIIMAHSCMTVRMQTPDPDLVVVDESYWQTITEIQSIKAARLYELAAYKPQESAQYISIINTIFSTLRNQPVNYLQALRSAGIKSPADLEPAAHYIATLQNDIHPISPEQSDDKIQSALCHYGIKSPVLQKVSTMLQLLGNELSQPRHTGHVLKCDKETLKIHSRKDPTILHAVKRNN